MRTLCLLLFAAVATSALAARTQAAEPRCAFADPSFTTLTMVLVSVADYYVKYRRWPLTKEQMRDEALRSVRALPAAQRVSSRDIDQVFARFGSIEFQPRGRDLVLAVDYHAEGKRQRQRILFHPGRSADQILEESTPAK
jgi:hypothetical protein